MSNAERMLEVAKARVPELAVGEMSSQPSRKVAVLTCMDVRIDPLRMFGLERGEAHVLRNAGGIVTDDVIRSLSASQRLLGTTEVIVMMHEHCGLCGGSEDEFASVLAKDGTMPGWRLGAFTDIEAALSAGLARLRASLELSSRQDIYGFIFDPSDGSLRALEQ